MKYNDIHIYTLPDFLVSPRAAIKLHTDSKEAPKRIEYGSDVEFSTSLQHTKFLLVMVTSLFFSLF
jgi:hypothetical protein